MSIALQKADFQKVISIEEYELMNRQFADFGHALTSSVTATETSQYDQAMKYIEVTDSIALQQKVYNFFSGIEGQYSWFVFIDKDCRYLAYILPVIQALATAADDIELSIVPFTGNEASNRYYSGDENDWFPTLIGVNKKSSEVIFAWNSPYSSMEANLRESCLSLTDKKMKMEWLDDWFEKDRGQTIQLEIYELFKQSIL